MKNFYHVPHDDVPRNDKELIALAGTNHIFTEAETKQTDDTNFSSQMREVHSIAAFLMRRASGIQKQDS